jgi:hypothetical protein
MLESSERQVFIKEFFRGVDNFGMSVYSDTNTSESDGENWEQESESGDSHSLLGAWTGHVDDSSESE